MASDAIELERVLRAKDPRLRTAANDAERTALWAGRLAAMHAYKATGKEVYVCDVTVPRQRLPEMVRRAREVAEARSLDVAVVGHAGDGNLHPVILYLPEELDAATAGAAEFAGAALDLGGTLTGEHGIGTAKLPQMSRRFAPTELAAFRAIKRAFDPTGVLNPGVMLPAVSAGEPDMAAFEAAVVRALSGRRPRVDPGVRGDELIAVDTENMTVTAGAAARCADVAAAAAARGLSCQAMETEGLVGETIESAGNLPPARAALLAVEAELPGGHHARFGSAAMKDVAGLDAKRLLAGGQGAFGKVERVTLRAIPRRG